jgi:hypothetical protein
MSSSDHNSPWFKTVLYGLSILGGGLIVSGLAGNNTHVTATDRMDKSEARTLKQDLAQKDEKYGNCNGKKLCRRGTGARSY